MASVALHGALIVIGVMVTWSVIQVDTRSAPRPIVADFQAVSFLPVDELPVPTVEVELPPELDVTPPGPIEIEIPGDIDATMKIVEASRVGHQEDGGEASFAGVRATNARSIAYVIDASGSMTTWLPLVLKALSNSLERLDPAQRYAVFFFKSDASIGVPPGKLQAARTRSIRKTMAWTKVGANLIPGGGSNPLPALEAALRLEPDVVFLLSEGLDGPGGSTIERAALLKQLDELNPIADPVTGQRWTRIQCIRVGPPGDPIEENTLMHSIADRYGGPGGWTSLDRSDLVTGRAGEQQ